MFDENRHVGFSSGHIEVLGPMMASLCVTCASVLKYSSGKPGHCTFASKVLVVD